MTDMRVIHTGPEHRPQVEPVFEAVDVTIEVLDVTSCEGGTEATPEKRGLRPRTTSTPDPGRTLRS